MYRRGKYKQRLKEFAGEVRGLFKREGTNTPRSNTPPGTPPHTVIYEQHGRVDSSSTGVPGALLPYQASTGPVIIQPNNDSRTDNRPELVTSSTPSAPETDLQEARTERVVLTEQVALPLQALEQTSGEMPTSRTGSDAAIAGKRPASNDTPRTQLSETPIQKSMKLLATGLLESAADALKIGPLQDISNMLQGFTVMYQLEGTIEKEYEELQQRLQTLLKVVDSRSDGGISPAIETKMNEIRDFIKGELNSVPNNQTGQRHGRLRMAKDEEERFVASCRRIQEYMERLSLDTTLLTWKLEERQSNDRVATLIRDLPSSLAACYDSIAGQELKRRECTPGTRLSVLAHLYQWTHSNSTGGVYWMNGMAGTGKTTIAYSACKALHTERKLGASFFCSRLREECRDVKVIIPSIAYQLAQFSPAFQSALSTALEKEPDAHTKRLNMQFKALIGEPLLAAKPSIPEGLIVVIDALDECDNKESTRDILDLLLNDAADLPIRFIVSSRPEPQICDKMNGERAKSRLVLHELDKGEVKADVEKYLREGLAPMGPSNEEISALVEKAGILFIYVATAVRYIGYDNFQSDPKGRLGDILNGPQSPEDEGNDSEIDQLYTTILDGALGNRGLRKAQRDDMRQVIHTVICAREPLTVEGLSGLLGVKDVVRIRAALRPLWSVLHVVGDTELVTTLHASFPDFMFDSTRSKSYWCDSNSHHHKLAEHCFDYIARSQPQVNICGLESYLRDSEVPDIERRVANAISSGLLYACRYWADHIEAAQCASSVLDQLQLFLSTRLLLWMEVLNLNNRMNAGTWCMRVMARWYKALQSQEGLMELASDARRFVDAFAAGPVSQSTSHIYVSMLTFWPKSAPISKHYAKSTKGPVEAEGTALDRRQLAHLSTWKFKALIRAIVVSTDGLYLGLAVGNDVLVVDSSSGRVALGPLQGHTNEVISIAFSPDGSRILAGSNDQRTGATILGWDTRTGDTVIGPLQVQGHTNDINCLSFSPDCSRIATGSDDGTVRLWDAETGRMQHQLDAQDPVYAAVFSPDGTQVAAGAGKTLHRWDSYTGKSILTLLTHANSIVPIAYSPDQSCIISQCFSIYAIYVWDALSGDMIRSLEGHTDHIRCVGFSPDGRYIVSSSKDRTVRVWDAQSGKIALGPLEGHTGLVYSVTFSPDGSRIISGCTDGLVCTWDAHHHHLASSSAGASSDPITCVKFSSDGARFVSGSDEGTICIWDADTGEMVVGPVKVHRGGVEAIEFKSHHVVSGSADGEICVCDAQSGEIVPGPFQVGSEAIYAIAYFPDGGLIATGSSAGVDVWSAQDGRRILGPLTDLRSYVLSVQFSPDGTRIVASSGGYSSNVVVWDVSDGRNVFGTLDGHDNWVHSVSYSPNGALIASGSDDNTAIIWDAGTGEKAIGPLMGHSHWVFSVSFSPDSTRLVSGSGDRTIRIWDVQTGEMVFELLHGHKGYIRSVEYSPDGTRIMSHSYDGIVRIHDVRSPEERARSRSETEVGYWTMDKDGWVVDDQSRLLVWVPGDLRKSLVWPATRVLVGPHGYVRLKFEKSRMGESWAQSYMSHV